MKKKSILTLDILLIIITLALIVIGVLFIYSSGISSTGILLSREYVRQIIWAVSGIALMILIALIDYERFKSLAPYIYGFFILLLISLIVLVIFFPGISISSTL